MRARLLLSVCLVGCGVLLGCDGAAPTDPNATRGELLVLGASELGLEAREVERLAVNTKLERTWRCAWDAGEMSKTPLELELALTSIHEPPSRTHFGGLSVGVARNEHCVVRAVPGEEGARYVQMGEVVWARAKIDVTYECAHIKGSFPASISSDGLIDLFGHARCELASTELK